MNITALTADRPKDVVQSDPPPSSEHKTRNTEAKAAGVNAGAMNVGTSAVPTENRTPLPKPNSVAPSDRTPTLQEVGISKDLSSRSQAIASIPQDGFDRILTSCHEMRECQPSLDAGRAIVEYLFAPRRTRPAPSACRPQSSTRRGAFLLPRLTAGHGRPIAEHGRR